VTIKNYQIKTMSPSDMDMLIEWAAEEGWNPGLYDAQLYRLADSSGFLMGVLDGEPIATLSAVRYGKEFGFLGFYIVKPQYRGQGYGIALWHEGMKYLKDCVIGLDGVPAQQANYEKSGFKLAYRNVRYQGVAGVHGQTSTDIRPLASLPFAVVNAYDAAFFPVNRQEFTKHWISQPGATALGIVDGEKLVGYGTLRKCREGYKVGPLFADSPAQAESLFLALCANADAGEPIFIDVPACHRHAVALCERHGMRMCFETARMYFGAEPRVPLDRVYGVTSFEIG